MMPGFIRRGVALARRTVLQAIRKEEPSKEPGGISDTDGPAAIAAQLRALIPCSTDPAWLERMAREVESRAPRVSRALSPAGRREQKDGEAPCPQNATFELRKLELKALLDHTHQR